ncbi:acetyltransferase [Bacillus sp. OTU2372]|uniref:acetyltransferase n=1 Tax=Bacillus sp. OTU2372 TaxID=3043858 RepID=UPI00313C7F6D
MKIVIIGHGGHSKVISDLIISQTNSYEIVGVLDDKFIELKQIGNVIYGPILSAIQFAENFKDIKFIIAIGDNMIRKKIVKRLNIADEHYITLVHTSAVISPASKIGYGTVVLPNAVINAESEIGQHSIINTGAIIEHDCKIGNFIHLSPRATLTGAVQIDDGVSIGAGATIIPNIKIGEWSIIGAGATVINNIPSYCTAMGVPARVKKGNEGEFIAKYNI